MSLLVGGSYTLHYYDENNQPVSVPLEVVDGSLVVPDLHDRRTSGVVIYDEVGEVTAKMLERAKAYAEVRELRQVTLVDMDLADVEVRSVAYAKDHPEMLEPLEATFKMTRFDERAFKNAFLGGFPVEDRRPKDRGWQERRKQHRNRKRRAWR